MDTTLQKILELMEKNDMDNQALAEQLGLNRQVVTDWKAGRSKSYRKYLYQIAVFLGTSVEVLKGETDIKEKTPTKVDEFTELFSKLTDEQKKLVVAQMKGILSDK